MNSATASHTDHELPARKVKFDLSKTPLHWIPGDGFSSHLINVLHLLLPPGEFWFCRLYNKALPLVTDERLREDVKGFVRQEAIHGRSHDAAVNDYLNRHRIDISPYRAFTAWLFEVLLADNPFGRKLPERMQKPWLVFRLGIVACVEHLTCVLGKYIIQKKHFDERGADPDMMDLLRWHGAEEIEHRCVAFDLYQHLGGHMLLRWIMAIIVPLALLMLFVVGACLTMRQDPAYRHRVMRWWSPTPWLMWIRTARAGYLPSPLQLLREMGVYFRSDYNPLHEADTEEALAYLRSSPAVIAATRPTAAG